MIRSTPNLRSVFGQIGAAACALLLSCTAVYAETVEIVTEDLPPLHWVQNDVVTGPATEIVTTAMQAAGLAYTIQAYPWSRAYQIALHRRNVCIFSIVKLKERVAHFKWAGSLFKIRNHFYKLAARKDVVVHSIEDVRRYNTVVVRDDISHHFLLSQGFVENSNFYICNDYLTTFRLLYAGGGISLMINDDATVQYRTKKLGLDPAELEQLFEIPELTTDMQVAFSQLTPIEMVRRFSKALEQMKKDGRFERIIDKWRTIMKDW